MAFWMKRWRKLDPVAIRLARTLFDEKIIRNEFRRIYLKELVARPLQRQGWRDAGIGRAGCDFEHLDGSRLKIMQSAARQTGLTDDVAQTRPVFPVRSRAVYELPDASPDIIVVAWHPVAGLHEADHRNADQWEFFVVPKTALPQRQRTLGLPRLREIAAQQGCGPVPFAELAGAVEGWRLRLRAEIAVQANERVPLAGISASANGAAGAPMPPLPTHRIDAHSSLRNS